MDRFGPGCAGSWSPLRTPGSGVGRTGSGLHGEVDGDGQTAPRRSLGDLDASVMGGGHGRDDGQAETGTTAAGLSAIKLGRSEERRVGKECSEKRWPYEEQEKKRKTRTKSK